MDRYRPLILLSLLCALLLTGSIQQRHRAILALNRGTGAAAPTYLLSEGFEGTGYENAGWTEAGSADEDYTTTVLEGAQSLFFNINNENTRHAVTPTATTWVYCLLQLGAIANNNEFIRLRNATVSQAVLRVNGTTGALHLTHGTTTKTTSITVAAGTTYHVWLHYLPGTGADGSLVVYVNTTADRATALTDSLTTGTATVQIDELLLQATSGGANTVLLDKIRVDDVAIGSNPT